MADKGTARTFYAAGNFFDILAQFGELSEEVKQKKKYAKWKAADILAAIKEGRAPTPGGFGEEIPAEDDGGIPAAPTAAPIIVPLRSDASLESIIPQAPGLSPTAYTPHPNPAAAYAPAVPPADAYASPYAPAPAYAPASVYTPAPVVPAPSTYAPPRTPTRPKDAAVNDAMDLCNYAIAALKVWEHMCVWGLCRV